MSPRRSGGHGRSGARARRRAPGWIAGALAALAAVMVVAIAGLPVYVYPPASEASRADLVYVIGPPTEARLAEAERLRAAGVADRILVSVPLEGEQAAESLDVCDEPSTTCLHPEPFTTKGEALLLRDYAAAHGVGSTIVITFTPHVSRTRYIFDRCGPTGVTVAAVEPDRPIWQWAYQYAYQTAAFVKAWLTPCSDTADL